MLTSHSPAISMERTIILPVDECTGICAQSAHNVHVCVYVRTAIIKTSHRNKCEPLRLKRYSNTFAQKHTYYALYM